MKEDLLIVSKLLGQCCTPGCNSMIVGKIHVVLREEVLRWERLHDATDLRCEDARTREQFQKDGVAVVGGRRWRRRYDGIGSNI